jgi:hypothetical protein
LESFEQGDKARKIVSLKSVHRWEDPQEEIDRDELDQDRAGRSAPER